MSAKASRFLDFIRGALFAIAALSGSAAVCAQLGRWSDKLDAFTHLAPFWLLGGSASALLWALLGRRGRWTPVLALVAVTGSVLLIAPELIAARKAVFVEPRSETLKIIQFNIFEQNFDVPATLAWIRRQNADVVIMEEAHFQSWPVVEGLDDLYPYRTGCAGHDLCSTQILSKAAPLHDPAIQLDRGNGVVAWAQFKGSKGLYSIMGVHYVWPEPASPQWINRYIMLRNAARFPKDSLIVTGDFNSTPWSFALRNQDRQIGLLRRDRAIRSWPARFLHLSPPPFLPLDHVYAGSDWHTVSVERGPRLGSDHFPIVAVLTR